MRRDPAGRSGQPVWLAAFLWACAAFPVAAADARAPAESGLERSRWDWLTNGERWRQRHGWCSERVSEAVERFDRFFGDERLGDDNCETRVTLGMGLEHDGEEGLSLLSDLRVRLALPRITRRIHLVLDDAFDTDDPTDVRAIEGELRDRKPDAGLRYFFHKNGRMRLSGDVGARFGDPFQLFGRGRWRGSLRLDEWELRVTETVYWFTEDGWRETTEMTWSRPLPACWLFRSSSRVTWEEKNEGVKPAQEFSMSRGLSRHRAYRVFVGGAWPEAPSTREANYTTGFVYRQLIHGDWLFAEVSTAVEFPQKSDYDPNPIVGLKFEVVFGER